MQVAVFSACCYGRRALVAASRKAYSLRQVGFLDERSMERQTGPGLGPRTARPAVDHSTVSAFTNNDLGRETRTALAETDHWAIVLRCAGVNNIDFHAANELEFRTGCVLAYSTHAAVRCTIGVFFSEFLLFFDCQAIGVDPGEPDTLPATGIECLSQEQALTQLGIVHPICSLHEQTCLHDQRREPCLSGGLCVSGQRHNRWGDRHGRVGLRHKGGGFRGCRTRRLRARTGRNLQGALE